MSTINFDLLKTNGKIKIMNAVNNGPAVSAIKKRAGNAEYYAELEIPYARNHDASAASFYGGEHTVDVHRIFKNFDADENDPASYVFSPTDNCIRNTLDVGTKPFYRLGASIEHGYKYGTYPPKDFAKWARICEHIIRHYTEGWANGFNYDIEYWEIWNEPDCYNSDGTNPCWQGTPEEFIDFYEIAAKYLKSKFPHLKIGGPAFTKSIEKEERPIYSLFFNALKERNIPMDFYSFHGYMFEPQKVQLLSEAAVNSFKSRGMDVPELICDEWNYIKAWYGDEYNYSRRERKGTKGASLVAGAMCVGQASDIDMMMYYDARPCAWCGLFDTDELTPLKPYYTFRFFRDIRKLGTYVTTDSSERIYSCGATDGKNSALMFTYYDDDDSTPADTVKITFSNVKSENGVRVEYYLIDKNHDGSLIREETFTSENFAVNLDLKLFDTYLIKITAL